MADRKNSDSKKQTAKKKSVWKAWLAGLIIFALIFGAYKFMAMRAAMKAQMMSGTQQQQTGPMPVTVVTIKKEPVQRWKEFSARLRAVDYAEIRPQVSGRITEVLFTEGQYVNEGQELFVIDPRPFKAALNQAKADLNLAITTAKLADKEFERAKKLIKTDAISKSVLDQRQSEKEAADAAVESVKARVERAMIDMSYAYVKAPITGRASRAEITEGNLVEAGPNAPVLTSIVSEKGIYADFDVDENSYLNNIRAHAQTLEAENRIPVELVIPGTKRTYHGKIHTFDNRIDPNTGTIRARALFLNKDKTLLPGMVATIRLGSAKKENLVMLDARTIGTDQDRKFVYVVNAESKTEYRPITLGDSIRGKRVILSGLEEGDQVINKDLLMLRPNMPVKIMDEAEAASAVQQGAPKAP